MDLFLGFLLCWTLTWLLMIAAVVERRDFHTWKRVLLFVGGSLLLFVGWPGFVWLLCREQNEGDYA